MEQNLGKHNDAILGRISQAIRAEVRSMANEPDSLEADTGSLLESHMDMKRSNCGPHSSWGNKTDLRLEEIKWERMDKLIAWFLVQSRQLIKWWCVGCYYVHKVCMVMLTLDKIFKLPNNVFLVPKRKDVAMCSNGAYNGFVNKLSTIKLPSFLTQCPPYLVSNKWSEKKKVNKLPSTTPPGMWETSWPADRQIGWFACGWWLLPKGNINLEGRRKGHCSPILIH